MEFRRQQQRKERECIPNATSAISIIWGSVSRAPNATVGAIRQETVELEGIEPALSVEARITTVILAQTGIGGQKLIQPDQSTKGTKEARQEEECLK